MFPDVLSDPRALLVLGLIIAAVVQYQRSLSWSEYRTIHSLKRGVLPLVQRHTSLFVVSEKGDRDGAEYVGTTAERPKAVFKSLASDYGFSPHLINSIKRRPSPADGTPQYSIAHLVHFHDDESGDREKQTEVYLFRAPEGGTDVYAHHETSVEEGKAHLTETEQIDGDPKGTIPPWVTDAR